MKSLISALLVALGLTAAGALIGQGIFQASQDRYVTVKGLAEKDVKANIALWSLRYVAAGNKLSDVQTQLAQSDAAVTDFLASFGLADDIVSQKTEITDRAAQAYGGDNYTNRFLLNRTLMLRSTQVDQVERAAQKTGDLVNSGVILDAQYSSNNNLPVYLFDGLNQLKPSMIAEATHNARQAAEQFANDSDSQLNGIIQANQGVFEILSRDKAPMLEADQQLLKTVRVVVTIRYQLKD